MQKATALLSVVGAVGALAFGVAGLAAGEITDRTVQRVMPVAFAPVAEPAAPMPPRAALRDVMVRMNANTFASVSVGPTPPDVRQLDPRRATLPWFYANVRVSSLHEGLDIKPLWMADLVQGVIAERTGSANNIREDFGGSTFHVTLPSGKEIDVGGGLGDVARGQVFVNPPNAHVSSSIRQALRDIGLQPIFVEVLRPDGSAPAVVARTNDAESAAKALMRIVKAIFGDPPRYEGYYFELQNADGMPIVRMSTSFRTGAGRSWRAPGWEDLVAVKTFGSFASRDVGLTRRNERASGGSSSRADP